MPEGMTWPQVAASYDDAVALTREQAAALHRAMIDHLMAEAVRTGAKLTILSPTTSLPKTAAASPLAVRIDVTAGTVICTRQPHCSEDRTTFRRSWRIELGKAPAMPPAVSRGLTGIVEKIAVLQGDDVDEHAPELDFT